MGRNRPRLSRNHLGKNSRGFGREPEKQLYKIIRPHPSFLSIRYMAVPMLHLLSHRSCKFNSPVEVAETSTVFPVRISSLPLPVTGPPGARPCSRMVRPRRPSHCFPGKQAPPVPLPVGAPDGEIKAPGGLEGRLVAQGHEMATRASTRGSKRIGCPS